MRAPMASAEELSVLHVGLFGAVGFACTLTAEKAPGCVQHDDPVQTNSSSCLSGALSSGADACRHLPSSAPATLDLCGLVHSPGCWTAVPAISK